MISIQTVIRKKKLSNGKFPIYLRITKNRKSKFFKTIYNTNLKEWNNRTGEFNNYNENYLQNNRLLNKFKNEAIKIITNLKIENEDFSITEFERRFRIVHNPVNHSLFEFWDEIIGEMKFAGRMGNARFYTDTKTSILRFVDWNMALTFSDITPAFLEKFEAHLRARGGTDGGISVKMRGIRAIYNTAVRRNLAKESQYPFKNYKISRLKGKSPKRALAFEEVKRIVDLDLTHLPHLINSRNYFVFSFYTRGMNFADMMKLEWANVSEDRIYYIRSKTKGDFQIKIVEPVHEILNYYKENSLHTKYVFPILLFDNLTPNQIEHRKAKTLSKYNKDLKEIARFTGIKKSLTSYVARHSFANCLKQKGVSTDIISESLGHQNIAITQIYLKELDNRLVDEAVEVLV